jgi:hypothetical protein
MSSETWPPFARQVDKDEGRPIVQYNRWLGGGAMLPKSVVACFDPGNDAFHKV